MNYVIELVVIIAVAYLALDADDSYRAGNRKHNLKSWIGLGLAGILTIFLICNAFA